jgi:putative transposase
MTTTVTIKNPVVETYSVTIHCKLCSSTNLVRFGTYKTVQRYYCKDCRHKFAGNGALPGMRISTEIIGAALNAYYEGMSCNAVRRHLKQICNYRPSDSTVYEWVSQFSQVAIDAAKGFKAHAGEIWVADETMLKIGGQNMWFWDIIDDKTRFLLASHISLTRTTKDAKILMKGALEHAYQRPTFTITDKLQAYMEGLRAGTIEHYQSQGFDSEINTNLIERFHGTLKARTKVMRGLKYVKTGERIMGGWLVHYNFFRPHEGLDNITPGEAAGVEFPFKNWREIVEGANIKISANG